jgi:hypothetical protein
MRSMFDIANDYVGGELIIRGKSYGIVTEVVSVCSGSDTIYGLVTDQGKRLRLASVLRALNDKIASAVYPDGTAYSDFLAQPKKLYRANAVFAANIDSTANIGEEKINIANRPGD